MNGIPVYPLSKNGERPYLATPEPGFLDPKIPDFRPFSGPPPPILFVCTLRAPINHTQLSF